MKTAGSKESRLENKTKGRLSKTAFFMQKKSAPGIAWRRRDGIGLCVILKNMKKVLVFGTFDVLHQGHIAMLAQAKQLGDFLAVAVAPDKVVSELKKRKCIQSEEERVERLRAAKIADQVVLADRELNSWQILSEVKPDIVALGYDQQGVKVALEKHFVQLAKGEKKPTIVILKPHEPEKYKSSLLNKYDRR